MSSQFNDQITKAVSTGLVAAALNKFYLNNDNNSSLYLGAAVAGGNYIGQMGAFIVPEMNLPVLGNGKGLGQRIVESGTSVGASYAINTYILKNTTFRENIYDKIGVIVVSDILGEYIADFMAGRPLSFLA